MHRGRLQVALYEALIERAGVDVVETNARATGFETHDDHAVLVLEDGRRIEGDLLIAADGIHSALRARMYPDEGEPIWNGRVLWRATTRARSLFREVERW